MRKLLTLVFSLLSSASLIAQGPIVIVSSDMPTAGDTLYSATDTVPVGFSIGSAGASVKIVYLTN